MKVSDFDGQIAWRFLLAFVCTTIGIILIIGIFTAPLGVVLIALGCKPLKNYMMLKQGQLGEQKYERAIQRRAAEGRRHSRRAGEWCS